MATEKDKTLTAKKGEEGDLKEIWISSNEGGKSVNISPATTQFYYYESILDNTIRVTLRFVDTGNTIQLEDGLSVIEGLPIVGTERVDIVIEDANEEKVEVTLYVNTVTPISESTQNNTVDMTLVSKEFFVNENGKTRVVNRFDGLISKHIKKVLTEEKYLATDKDVSDIEETSNSYNCWGRNLKPFAFTNWIQQKGIPSEGTNTGGFFLWETSKGFHFRSVDGLMSQDPKLKLIYNNIQDVRGENIPPEYDGQILDLQGSNNINVKEKLELGSYVSRIVLFDPFNCKYEIVKPTAKKKSSGGGREKPKKMEPKMAGKELPPDVFNKEIDFDFTRTTYMLWDSGTLPTGNTNQQIEKSKEHNLKPEETFNQSKMRYNQMFTIQRSITIPGDFTLQAGDAIFIDVPEVSDKKDKDINQQVGGLYIIVDLCHYMSGVPPACFTRLNLTRDSYKRKPA